MTTGQRIGYKRVSSSSQSFERQQLGKLDKVFEDKLTGKNTSRPGLNAMLSHVRQGDTLVVFSLDRLGRNSSDLQNIIKEIGEKGVVLHILHPDLQIVPGEPNPWANFIFTVMSGFAELEREMINERQRQGIEKALKRGVKFGRRPIAPIAEVIEMRKSGMSGTQIAGHFKITRQSIHTILKRAGLTSAI